MFRQRTGSSLCYRCGKLNRVDATECFYCGARRPGLWGFGPGVGRLMGRLDFARAVTVVCIALYVASILLDPRAAFRTRNPFDMLAPSNGALIRLGMTGAVPWAAGFWWTLFTAIYLHGSLLHILFNLLWVRQLAPPVEQIFGGSRLVVIFTVAGALGFVLSNFVGVTWTIGASGAIFGLLGAMVAYGRSRGGSFGVAVFRQYGQWALIMFIFGFFMAGVNNWGHLGGFVGGYLVALAMGPLERAAERGLDRIAAFAAIAVTLIAFLLAFWTGFRL
ncbi:MAG TPA: rhomboid family intramembrane serine protease [Methylomirabilota bacterium]